jgi:uncharacterized protein with PIN domain
LRAAGYDVVIATPGADDNRLLKQARDEQRIMLSRDRKLLEYSDAAAIVSLLTANRLSGPHGQLAELSARFVINWLCRPFSRCLECNSELVPATYDVLARVSQEALREGETVLYCRHCDKPYWYSSYVTRMRRQLNNFSQGIWDGSAEDDATPTANEKRR